MSLLKTVNKNFMSMKISKIECYADVVTQRKELRRRKNIF